MACFSFSFESASKEAELAENSTSCELGKRTLLVVDVRGRTKGQTQSQVACAKGTLGKL